MDNWLTDVAYAKTGKTRVRHEDLSEDRFYYPLDYLLQTWHMFDEYGVLPRAGGWDDQCSLWAQDIMRITRRYNHIMTRVMNGDTYETGEDGDLSAFFADETDVLSFSELTSKE